MNVVIVYSSLMLDCTMVMLVLEILLCVLLLMSTLGAVLMKGKGSGTSLMGALSFVILILVVGLQSLGQVVLIKFV